MPKTIAEINSKIKAGEVVVVTAKEMKELVAEKGFTRAAKEVDVVTTGTFAPMSSSGMYINIGHSKPKIKLGGGRCYLNNVPACCGFAAVDIYLGSTQVREGDPKNNIYPGQFEYGGGHVIEEFVAGKDIQLRGWAYGTDCYPRQELQTWINIKEVNEAVLFNPRNCEQNYNVAVNLSDRVIYTQLGVLKPALGNANYCSAGEISPLLNDPFYQTIGIGTRIFLGGGIGYITWHRTQHNLHPLRGTDGLPREPGAALAVIGDLKQMSPSWLRGLSILGYGTSLMVGIGIPIPVLNEEIARFTGVKDKEIRAPVVDYSSAYPKGNSTPLAEVNYEELKKGSITLKGKKVLTASLSSYPKAQEITEILKAWIREKKFFLTQPVASLS
jgi:uncharacterized protein (DUF39 family)